MDKQVNELSLLKSFFSQKQILYSQRFQKQASFFRFFLEYDEKNGQLKKQPVKFAGWVNLYRVKCKIG